MNSFELLKQKIPNVIFEDQDLHAALGGLTLAARYSTLSRLLKSKKLLKIRRGLYAFNDKIQNQSVSKFSIAASLYCPSYISFESALSYHGLIPESVYTTTSACSFHKQKNYSTPFGKFTYDHVPASSFRFGVESISSNGQHFLMADPIKALFDLVYLRRKKYQSLENIESDLRIESSELSQIVNQYTYKELETLAHSYKKRNCLQLLKILVREIK